MPWDLTRTLELAESLKLIDDPARRGLVAGHLERFERLVVSRLDELPRSVIHNDANDHNLLVDTRDPARPRFAGVIDFGDMHQKAYVGRHRSFQRNPKSDRHLR